MCAGAEGFILFSPEGRVIFRSTDRLFRRAGTLSVALLGLALAGGAARADVRGTALEVREGTLEVFVEDDFAAESSRTVYRLRQDGGDAVSLDLAGPPPEGVRTGLRVRVSGRMLDQSFSVDRLEALTGLSDVPAPASAWTTGAKKVLVILLNFQNDTSQPYTVAQAQSTMFGATGSVAKFYSENSWDQTTLSGDVAGWFTAPIAKPTTCDISAVQTQAQTAATNAGYNRASYNFEVYVFPGIGSCGWAGLAYVGWSGAWINQALSTYVVSHELGHNYGLLHAHSWNCGTSVLGSSCSRSEYGDPYDTMGGGLRHFGSYAKWSLDWLPGAGTASISGGSGTFTLSGLEASSGVRGLQLLTDAGRTYWLEFRQPIGFDAGLSGNASAMNGVLVHLSPSAVGGTDLLDMTPDGNFGAAALTVGNSYTDAAASLRFTPTVVSSGTITVNVQYGVTPPTASFTFLPAAPKAGQAVTFTNASSGQPAGYLWSFGDGTTSSLKSPAHAFASAGTYTVSLIASNAAGPSTAYTKSVTVTGGTSLAFYSLPPCRLVDTRNANGAYGGPSLSSNVPRFFSFSNRCGVPSTAVALAVNATATRPTRAGYVSFAAGTSSVSFRAGQTRAANTVIALGSNATATATAGLTAAGTVDLVLDVSGYFQ
jgi:PKD repeat protein